MATNKPIPLVGRLAIQLKMLTQDEVERAMAESVSSGNPRLAQVFLQMGLLDREQIAKLQKVQKDLVEKHRAKKAGAEAAPTPPPAREAPAPVAEAAPEPPPVAPDVNEAAMHAAQGASPMQGTDVAALHEAPPEVAKPAPPEAQAPPAPAEPQPAAAPQAPAPPSHAAPAPPAAPAAGEDGPLSLELPIPTPGDADRRKLEAMLELGVAKKASDVHFHAYGPL